VGGGARRRRPRAQPLALMGVSGARALRTDTPMKKLS